MSQLIKTESVHCCLGDTHNGATKIASGYDFEYQTCDNLFEFYKAKDCDVIFLNPRPTRAMLPIIYPETYKPYHFGKLSWPAQSARNYLQSKKVKAVLRFVGKDAKILDAGAGAGILLRQFQRLIGNNRNLYANDLSEDILKPLIKEGFKAIVGSIDQIKPPEKFDAITLDQLIEHVENPAFLIKHLSSILEKGGILFIETPSIDALDARLFQKRYWGGYHIPRHFFLFNKKSLTRLVEEAGFKVIETTYLVNPTFWVQSIHHYCYDKGMKRLARLISDTNPILLGIFTVIDMIVLGIFQKTSNMRMIAQKI